MVFSTASFKVLAGFVLKWEGFRVKRKHLFAILASGLAVLPVAAHGQTKICKGWVGEASGSFTNALTLRDASGAWGPHAVIHHPKPVRTLLEMGADDYEQRVKNTEILLAYGARIDGLTLQTDLSEVQIKTPTAYKHLKPTELMPGDIDKAYEQRAHVKLSVGVVALEGEAKWDENNQIDVLTFKIGPPSAERGSGSMSAELARRLTEALLSASALHFLVTASDDGTHLFEEDVPLDALEVRNAMLTKALETSVEHGRSDPAQWCN